MNTTEKYSIRDLEMLSGVKAHTLRIWEKRYGIVKPKRSNTNIRHYNGDDLREILNISLLNKNGFKISAIAGMSLAERDEHLSTITLLREGSDGSHESLLLSLIELDEARFNQVFMSIIIRLGFEKAFTQVIFPFFEKIGLMWQFGSINAAQEHFFSNMVRQKIFAATDALMIPDKAGREKVLLFLPENEMHEIGLLFYNYAFRARGFRTVYLGQSVPLADLTGLAQSTQPDIVVTGMTSSGNPLELKMLISRINAAFPDKRIFYTGPLPEGVCAELRLLTVHELCLLLDLH